MDGERGSYGGRKKSRFERRYNAFIVESGAWYYQNLLTKGKKGVL